MRNRWMSVLGAAMLLGMQQAAFGQDDVNLVDPSPGLHEYSCKIVHVSGRLTGDVHVLLHGGQIIVDGAVDGTGASSGAAGTNGLGRAWAGTPVSVGAGGDGDSGSSLTLEIDEWCPDFTNSIDVLYYIDLEGMDGGSGGYGDYAAGICLFGVLYTSSAQQTGGAGGNGGHGGALKLWNSAGPVLLSGSVYLGGGDGGAGGSGGSLSDGAGIEYPVASAAAGNGTLGGDGGSAGLLEILASGQVELSPVFISATGGLGGKGGDGGSHGAPTGQAGEGGPAGAAGQVTIETDSQVYQNSYGLTIICNAGIAGSGGRGGEGGSSSCDGCLGAGCTSAFCTRERGKPGGRSGGSADGGEVTITAAEAITLSAEIHVDAGNNGDTGFVTGGVSGASGTLVSGTCGQTPCDYPYDALLGAAGKPGGNGGTITITAGDNSDLTNSIFSAIGGVGSNGGTGGQRSSNQCPPYTILDGAQGGEGREGGNGGTIVLDFAGFFVSLDYCTVNVCPGSGSNGGNGGSPNGPGGVGGVAGSVGTYSPSYSSASTTGFSTGTCLAADGSDGNPG